MSRYINNNNNQDKIRINITVNKYNNYIVHNIPQKLLFI